MSTRLHIVVSEELLARVDGALGPGQARADWIRRAVERVLDDPGPLADGAVRGPVAGWYDLPLPAPAEQPETPDFIREGGMAPASSYQRRDFRPYPKGGKR